MKVFQFYLPILLLSSFASDAQNEPNNSPASEAKIISEDTENIEVRGQRPASFYRKIVIEREDQFFAKLNTLVTSNDFNVTCEQTKKHAFSRIRTRYCEAKFVSKIKAALFEEQYASMSLSQILKAEFKSLSGPNAQLKRRISNRNSDFLNEVKSLLENDPELVKLYRELEAAKSTLATAHPPPVSK